MLTTETFFRPDELSHKTITISAALYNRCRLMLSRCSYEHVFVPIRTMQYLAVIDAEEIIFVDSLAYAVRGGDGGKLIVLSWQFRRDQDRDDLSGPAGIDLIYYHPEAAEIQKRLLAEFTKSLDAFEATHQERGCEPRAAKVLPFRGQKAVSL